MWFWQVPCFLVTGYIRSGFGDYPKFMLFSGLDIVKIKLKKIRLLKPDFFNLI
ncbi:Uncharacterised protein [Lederbergia lenta]|uniref:Uncharacterized protein n=1 Tax=Lederbergia lenta TaxID=1467 RepID=A0A2X4ZGE9_LEDLE|nr:Uncharacterised protein [Lederbergia lenta]